MADYRFSAQMIGRSSGRSATAAAAYRAAERIVDERTGDVHDYTRKEGVLHSEIIAPDNAPDWMHDRAQLWNAVEIAERRGNSQLAREIQLSLPHELTDEQRVNLLRGFCHEQFVDRGMIADMCMHAPSSHEAADSRNVHAHVMLTTRELFGDGFDKKKQRDWNETELLEEWRKKWAEHQNRELERLGFEFRVDHRTLEEQGIARQPQKHLGPIASEIERDGRQSHRGRENEEIRKRNALIADLERNDNLLDTKIIFEKRKFETWAERKEEKLQIDISKRDAQFQVGLAARMMEFDKQIDTEFTATKDGLSKSHDEVAGRLEVRGWRKLVRDITLTTRQDKRELESVERELDTLRKAEEAKRIEQERLEAQRKQNITKDSVKKADTLKANIQKARDRREASDWMPTPQVREQVPTDWKEASKTPLPDQFNKVANRPHKPVERVETDSGSSGAVDPFLEKRAAQIRQQDALKNTKDHIGRSIAQHDQETNQSNDNEAEERATYVAERQQEANDNRGRAAQQRDATQAAEKAQEAQRVELSEADKRAEYVRQRQQDAATEVSKEPYHPHNNEPER